MFSSTVRSNTHRLMSFQKRFVHDVKVQLKMNCDNVEALKSRLQRFGVQATGDVVQKERFFYDRVPDAEVFSKEVGKLSQDEKVQQTQNALRQLKEDQETKWYELSASDTWLENTNGNWLCRVAEKNPLSSSSHLNVRRSRRIPKYRILNGEKEIRRELNIQQDVTRPETIKTLDADLASRGIKPFTKIVTKETNYGFDNGIHMTIIETNFGYAYAKFQRTCVNASIEDTQKTQRELSELARDLKLVATPYLREDIEEYIFRNRRETYYDTLVKAGVMQPEQA